MSELRENTLTVIDEEGNETLCQILFTFTSEASGKNFVIFYPVEALNNDEESIELSAAIYIPGENGEGQLSEITEEEDWQEVEDAIQDYEEHMMNHCGCGHDCDDCEDDCEEECGESCCCKHHE